MNRPSRAPGHRHRRSGNDGGMGVSGLDMNRIYKTAVFLFLGYCIAASLFAACAL